MSSFLFHYHPVSPATWVYLSSLLMIGLFFKFNRVWSVRNLDLLLLMLLSPGLLMIHYAQIAESDQRLTTSQEIAVEDQSTTQDTLEDAGDPAASSVLEKPYQPTRGEKLELMGFRWLAFVGLLWLVRILLDLGLTRRPLLAPNLSVGGMTFIGISLFVFLMANVIYQNQSINEVAAPDSELLTARMEQVLQFQSPERGPGYAALNALPQRANRVIAILSHLAIVTGIVLVGYRHFNNAINGIGAATLYLMLPYTSQMTGRVDHFLPAALLVWAIFFYRRPLVAGIFVGAAFGCIYYPMFLLPLWLAFYWRRGWIRFTIGVVIALATMMIGLRLSASEGSFAADLQRMFGWLLPEMQDLEGLWNKRIGGWDPMFRLPVLCICAVMAFSFLLWPVQKNLATLISCSAAIMLSSQFWHGFGGGLFVAWYLPLTLMMIFRPNLEDRVAVSVLKSRRAASPRPAPPSSAN